LAQSEDPLETFGRLMAEPDAAVDLGLAALLIARQEYPTLDSALYLAQLDSMALELRQRGADAGDEIAAIQALNRYLFQELGFRGNQQDYFDPRNSFLNDVLDRRLGIPITLSLIYLEVGRRLGLRLQGVAFPGHFLVKLPLRDGEVILDPYAQGASLGIQELEERAEQAIGARRLLRTSFAAARDGQ
jgi:regulator of sirC expression with transglutaminase-like and TPR domain